MSRFIQISTVALFLALGYSPLSVQGDRVSLIAEENGTTISDVLDGQQVPGDCPVTRTPDPPFKSTGLSGLEVEGYFWYGSDGLWTSLPENGVWSDLPGDEHGYSQKIAWWSEGYNWQVDPRPELGVTGKRLDGDAPALEPPAATNAYINEFGSVMLTGVNIPSEGCWEIAGEYKGVTLRFVVWVSH